jgi:hypothetical protein
MPTQIIKREDIAKVLKEWADGLLSAQEVLTWADPLYSSDEVDCDDWEDEDSVANEVLAAMDMLDMNLVIPEDVPIYLEFLKTPKGQFKIGQAKFEKQLSQIDLDARRAKLKDVFPYSAFLKDR